MPRIDLRIYKKALRTKMRALRQSMSPALKQEKDRLIFEKLVRLPQYKRADVVITYVSSEIEVDTRRLIHRALADGKRVAVPRCVPNSREMRMHYIGSMEELAPGAYGILEPAPTAEQCIGTKMSICIVPAFCNDMQGYRLGYGGGYYDRYLSRFSGVKVGVNYSECICPVLEHGRYDVPVQLLVTERSVHYMKPASQRGRAADIHTKGKRQTEEQTKLALRLEKPPKKSFWGKGGQQRRKLTTPKGRE